MVVLALAIVIVTIIYSFYRANNPPVYFTVISGEVTTGDGITYSDANEGKKIPLNVLTQINTDSQVASIQLWNGTVVILDSNSSIEFNRPNENEPDMSFAFNLLKGRVLVVNEKNGLIPIRIFIGSNNTVLASQSAMGLEVFSDSKNLNKVDCLFGKCLINGVHLLMTGQNAQIGPGEIIQVTEGESMADWISLWNASNLKPELKNLLVSFIPIVNPTIIHTAPNLSTDLAFLSPISTLINSATPTQIVLRTVTPSRTNLILPSPTLTPSRTIKPFRLPSLTKTLSEENDPGPTRTLTPSSTPVPQATPTQTLTPTLFPTNTPSPSYTPIPSDTLSPTETSTLKPTKTPIPTKTPVPTDTDLPQPTATDVPQPTATDLPEPTPTDDDD